jgi:hypothetical protein
VHEYERFWNERLDQLECSRKVYVGPETGEHTREQPRLNLPTGDHENFWEIVETIDL